METPPCAKKNSLSLFLKLLKRIWESTAVAGSALVLIWPPPLLFSWKCFLHEQVWILLRYLTVLIIKIINSLRTSSLRHSNGGVKEGGELGVASQDFVFWKINFLTNKGSPDSTAAEKRGNTRRSSSSRFVRVWSQVVKGARSREENWKSDKTPAKALGIKTPLSHPSPPSPLTIISHNSLRVIKHYFIWNQRAR